MPSMTQFFFQQIQEKNVLISGLFSGGPWIRLRISAMKKSGLLAASVAAASAISASSSSPSSSTSTCNSNFQYSSEDKKEYENPAIKKSASTEKFAPRFDGLRFIETLVTAHR